MPLTSTTRRSARSRRASTPSRSAESDRKREQRAREERAGTGTVADLVEQFVHRKLRAERWDDARRCLGS